MRSLIKQGVGVAEVGDFFGDLALPSGHLQKHKIKISEKDWTNYVHHESRTSEYFCSANIKFNGQVGQFIARWQCILAKVGLMMTWQCVTCCDKVSWHDTGWGWWSNAVTGPGWWPLLVASTGATHHRVLVTCPRPGTRAEQACTRHYRSEAAPALTPCDQAPAPGTGSVTGASSL